LTLAPAMRREASKTKGARKSSRVVNECVFKKVDGRFKEVWEEEEKNKVQNNDAMRRKK